jgi:hypothetical protein
MRLQEYNKSFCGFKAATGAEVTPEMLAKINRWALKELSADQVYVRKYLIAHNGVDRDRERFPEEILDDFARTLPGKSFIFAHDRGSYLPMGLWFDATTAQITPEQFKELTGEEIRLPDGVNDAKVVWGWVYVLKTSSSEDLTANIDAGVYRHVSIGFMAKGLEAVKGEYDQILFWQYQAPGEATEASLVWLGAQPGATAQKKAGTKPKPEDGGKEAMNVLVAKLGGLLGKQFSDDSTADTITAAVKEALGEKIAEINTLTAKVNELQPLADEGKAFRQSLVDEFARMKAALGECEETEEAVKKCKGFGVSMPIDYLKAEVKHLEDRMIEKFPDGQVKGDMRRDKSADGNKSADDNPLIPKD